MGDSLIGIDFRENGRRGSGDWLQTFLLKSYVVKEMKEVRGQLERVMKSREGFIKMGKLIACS